MKRRKATTPFDKVVAALLAVPKDEVDALERVAHERRSAHRKKPKP